MQTSTRSLFEQELAQVRRWNEIISLWLDIAAQFTIVRLQRLPLMIISLCLILMLMLILILIINILLPLIIIIKSVLIIIFLVETLLLLRVFC